MELKTIISEYREKNNISQREFARRSGLSNSLISILEMGVNPQTGKKMSPDLATYKKIATGMNISMQALFEMIGDSEEIDLRRPEEIISIKDMTMYRTPLIGSTAAGAPINDPESWEEYIDSPVKADYALRVKGDSMEPLYLDGDIVYIRETPEVYDGKIAVVLVDDSVTLKYVYHIPNGLQLASENKAYKAMDVTWPEYDTIRILGVPVGYTRMYK